ncbi:hypothetical protein ACLMJK_008818 [Lecanora helva]
MGINRVLPALFCLLIPILAAPSTIKEVSYNATYDDLPQSLGIEPISVYDKLKYQGFNVITPGPQSQPVIVTPSQPNVLAADLAAQLTTGGGALFTSNYTGSTVKYFDLESFAIACVIQTNTPIPAPSACRVQVTGVNAATGVTFVQDIDYNPGLTPPAHYLTVNFPVSFRGVNSVTLTILEATTLPTTTAIGLDNVVYRAYVSS